MELLLLKYGYLVLFFGVFLEGEAFLLAGAFLASRGFFGLTEVTLVALAANTLGAQFYYLTARVRGQQWFETRFQTSPRYRRLLDWMRKYGNWGVLISRFAFGFRILIPVVCGVMGMSQRRFFLLNVVAGVLWSIPTALLGYYFGSSVAAMFQQAHRYVMDSLAAGFVLLGVYLAFRHWRRVKATFQQLQWSDLHGLLPFVMGLIGVLNIVTAVMPGSERTLDQLQRWLPLEGTQESRAVVLFSGVALLQVTRSLARRKRTAWYAAVIVLFVSLLIHITDFDLPHSLVTGVLLAYLIYFRRRFYGRSDLASIRRAIVMAPFLGLMVFVYGLVGLAAAERQFNWMSGARPASEAFRAGVLIVKPRMVALNRDAGRFLTSIQVAGWIARVYILVLLLRPVILRDRQKAPREAVRRIFARHGNRAICAFAIQPDTHHMLFADGRGLVAYATKGAVAIACGDPMCAPEDFPLVGKEFTEHCVRHGWTPSVYLSCGGNLPAYQSLGFVSQPAAEEAIVDLTSWDPTRFGGLAVPLLSVWRYERGAAVDPFLDEQLEEVTEDWLQKRHIGEMGFTIGRFSLESLSEGPVFVLRAESRVEAFCAWLPYKNGEAMVLNLMRKRHDAPPGSAKMLLAESLRLLSESGVWNASLATISLRQAPPDVANPVDRDMVNVFSPRWEERFIVYPRGAALSRINRALAAVQFR